MPPNDRLDVPQCRTQNSCSYGGSKLDPPVFQPQPGHLSDSGISWHSDTRLWFSCLQEMKQHLERASRSADWTSRISFWEREVNVHTLRGLTALQKQRVQKVPRILVSDSDVRQAVNLCLHERRRFTSCWNLFVMQWSNTDVLSSALTVCVKHLQV